jgi:hypothetical protein
MWVIGSLSSKILFELLLTRITSGWHPLSFPLEGGPRSLWTSVYEAYKKANRNAEPANPRQFFRETLEANYGLQDRLDQKY